MTATKNESLEFVLGWMWKSSWFPKSFKAFHKVWHRLAAWIWKETALFVSRSDYLIHLGRVKVADCWRGGHTHGVEGDSACHLAPDWAFWSCWGPFEAQQVMEAALWVLIWRCLWGPLKLMRKWSRFIALSSLIPLLLSPWVGDCGLCADCLVVLREWPWVQWFLIHSWREKYSRQKCLCFLDKGRSLL